MKTLILYIQLLLLLPAILFIVAGCSGCFGPVNHVAPVERMPDDPAQRNFKILWDASRSVLKDHHFSIDRQDRREGVMTTYAEAGSHLAESWWRKDTLDRRSHRENLMHLIYRAARVKIFRLENSDNFGIYVEVAKARSNAVEPNVTDTVQLTHGQNISDKTKSENFDKPMRLRFTDLLAKPVSKETPPAGNLRLDQPMRPEQYLSPLGRDKILEQRIIHEIRRLSGTSATFINPAPVRKPK